MKTWIKYGAAAMSVAALSLPVSADILGFSLAAKAYNSDLTDNDNDKYDTSTNIEYVFAFEHPVPIVPNVRVAYADISFDAKDFSGFSVDQSFADATLYYELLDNIIELDLGLTARIMDASIAGAAISDTYDSDASNDNTSALLYGKIQGNLPVTGLSLGATIQGGGNGDDAITDAELYAQYVFGFGLGLSGGYRVISQELEFEDDDKNKGDFDSDFEGTYLALFFKF